MKTRSNNTQSRAPHVASLIAVVCSLVLGCAESPVEPSIDLATCTQEESCSERSAMFAIDKLAIEFVNDKGQSAGFDIDHNVSDGSAVKDCGFADAVSSDGRSGIDNQLGALLVAIGPTAFEVLTSAIDNLIETAEIQLLLEFVDSPDFRTAAPQGLAIRHGQTTPLLNQDGRFLPNQSLTLAQQPLAGYTNAVTMVKADDRTTLQSAPIDHVWTISFLGTPVRMRMQQTIVSATYDSDNRISGLVSGYLLVDDIQGILNLLGGDDEELRIAASSIIGQFSDTVDDQGECNGISTVIAYKATRVFTVSDPQVPVSAPLPAPEIFKRNMCQNCHATNNLPARNGGYGPSLVGLGSAAQSRVDGLTASEYIRQSITEPDAHVEGDFSRTMNASVHTFISDDELDRLVAWLATQ